MEVEIGREKGRLEAEKAKWGWEIAIRMGGFVSFGTVGRGA